MLSVLDVIAILQSVKTGTIDPDDFEKAIVKHLQLYKSCYGAKAFRPKHHYALHLPHMLRRHGFLLMTFTHERKHRLVTRYTRDRRNLKNWDSGAIEEITCHQLWELSQPFFGVCNTAQARGNVLIPLMELFPGVDANDMFVLNNISGNGGAINAGDVVSCSIDGQAQLGELMVAVGVRGPAGAYESYCVVSLWQPHPESADVVWPKYAVSRDNVKVVPLQHMDTVFTYRISADRTSCVVYMPLEVRSK
jgi:predicted outer membrane repeat protein